jgi:CRP/FNR family transcriptional regulator, anaerobic regulatory protein
MARKRPVGISRGDQDVSAPVSYLRSAASDARHTQRAFERGHEFTNPQHLATLDASHGTMLHEVSRSAALGSSWKGTCLFEDLDEDATAHVEELWAKRIRLRKGNVLYRAGARFNALYAITTGWCKTAMLARDGHEQVAGFYMTGEIIGLDGIDTDIHECQATAMEDTDVCPLPFNDIENLARRDARFQHNLHRLLMQRYARARTLMVVLGTMRSEQRLAVFLLDLSQRYQARGYSSCEFVLRTTRDEIGSYLGLKLETVSRLFYRFQSEGLIQVEGRTVKLLDRVALNRIVDCGT